LQLPLFAIAEKFFEYYWRQALPYASADVLRQNTGGPATILTLIARARSKYGPSLPTLKKDQASWTRLVNSFIPTLQEQPLWRLQKVGKEKFDFLYGPSTDSHSVQLRPGVAYCFRKFHRLIQEIVQSAWLRAVRSMNGEILGEQIDLSEFLFGSERNALLAIRPFLADLQDDQCFYCSRTIVARTGRLITLSRGPGILPISRTTWSSLTGNVMDKSAIAYQPCLTWQLGGKGTTCLESKLRPPWHRVFHMIQRHRRESHIGRMSRRKQLADCPGFVPMNYCRYRLSGGRY